MVDVALCRKVADVAELARADQHGPAHRQSEWLMQERSDVSRSDVTVSDVGIFTDLYPLEALKGCGTSACLAGFTVLLTAPEGTLHTSNGELLIVDGCVRYVETYAQEQLGLTEEQIDDVFYEKDETIAISRLRAIADEADRL
jgi:hypothetical protein